MNSIVLYPNVLYGQLNDKIAGQDEAKKAISSLLASHFTAIYAGKNNHPERLLLMGPTGCGKTHLINTSIDLLKKTGIKRINVNCSEISGETWKGRSLNDIKTQISKMAKEVGDKLLTEYQYVPELEAKEIFAQRIALRLIIVFDEFDKVAARDENSAESKYSAQHDFLAFIEESLIEVKINNELTVTINTKNMPMIFMGAFSDFN